MTLGGVYKTNGGTKMCKIIVLVGAEHIAEFLLLLLIEIIG